MISEQTMQPLMEQVNAQALVDRMDVPQFKRDLSRSSNVMWLIEHLGKRNAKHAEYHTVMRWMLDEALKRNLLKRSVVAKYKADLDA